MEADRLVQHPTLPSSAPSVEEQNVIVSDTGRTKTWLDILELFESWSYFTLSQRNQFFQKAEVMRIVDNIRKELYAKQKEHNEQLNAIDSKMLRIQRENEILRNQSEQNKYSLDTDNSAILSLKSENEQLKRALEEQKRQSNNSHEEREVLAKQLQCSITEVERQREIADVRLKQLESQLSAQFSKEKQTLLENFNSERRILTEKNKELVAERDKAMGNLSEARLDMDFVKKEYQEACQKHKLRKAKWHEERMRWLRIVDAATVSNSAHLQEIARQLGPTGSLRQSLDLSFSMGGCENEVPNRRHSYASGLKIPSHKAGSSIISSLCSSPREDTHVAGVLQSQDTLGDKVSTHMVMSSF